MSAFAALLARPGARALACGCALGWLAFASLGLAVVLLVEQATASFAIAGAAVGAFGVASGALAPLRGRLVDRRGRGALLALAGANAVATAALVGVCARGWPAGAIVAAAACAGAVVPPLMASARALWPQVAGAELRRTGHALNALLGDLGTVAGPLLAGALAALLGPAAALALTGGGAPLGALVIAAVWGRTARGEPGRAAAARAAVVRGAPACAGAEVAQPPPPARGVLRGNRGMQAIVGGGVAIGVAFGAIEVAAPALAGRDGSAALGAAPLAAFAAGSVAGSLWSGRRTAPGSPRQRYVAGFALFALVLTAAVAVRSTASLAAVLAAAGVGFGLLNVAQFELLDELVAERNAVEALTWLTSAEGLGMAVGATLAGALAG